MSEKIINVEKVELITLFGSNNHKLDKLKSFFPKIKIIARGNKIKVIGNNTDINTFSQKIELLVEHIIQYNSLTISEMENIILNNTKKIQKKAQHIITYTHDGKVIKAETLDQKKIVLEIEKNDMMFVVGPAGTGKTYTAVALAIKALKSKQVKNIILTRPAIEAGENLGFLPGDLKEKLDPYMQPLYDALSDMLPQRTLNNYIEKKIIQIAPLAFMRGRTLNYSFVILDEAQNTTINQMKMFLTRMGVSAKFIITGDLTQIDLPKGIESGLKHSQNMLKKIKDISFIKLQEKDIFRHTIVKKIINRYNTKK